MGCYYNFGSRFFDTYYIEAISYVDATNYQEGDFVEFYEYDKHNMSVNLDINQRLCSTYIADAVSYIDFVIVDAMIDKGYNVSMADLGFKNYE